MRLSSRAWCTAACLLGLLGCGADGEDAFDSPSGVLPQEPGGPSPGGSPGGAGPGGAGSSPLPPEKEVDVPFEAPQAGRTTVYVPNPGTHRVAAVNAQTFAIETLASGLAPTYAATVPGQDIAIVLNVGSSDASILRTNAGKTALERLPIGHDQNAIAIAPDGQHALVYFDARASTGLARSYQDVSVLNLTPGKEAVRGVSVGFRPRSVMFSRDSQRAFVVTEDGVSVIDLAATDAGPSIATLVSVGDKVGEAVSLDVQVAADGAFALARRDGDARLRLVDLRSGVIETLSLAPLQAAPPADAGADAGSLDAGADAGSDAGSVSDGGARDAGGDAGADAGTGLPLPAGNLDLSDLDLSPDGSYALAVVRNASTLLRIPIPGGFRDPTLISARRIEDVLVGSVVISKNGEVAALYSTAVPVEAIVLVDLRTALTPRAVRLRKAVRAVALSASGSHALVLHEKSMSAAPASSDDARIDASHGYSLVDVARGQAKLQLTPAALRERDLLVTPDASRVFMLLNDEAAKVRSVEMADLRSLLVTSVQLAKPPSSLGLIPDAKRIFVGQKSEGGMVTFLDAESGEVVHAVSGFELSGRVRQ